LHLHRIREGETVRGWQALVADTDPKLISYIADVGIFASTQRLEFFINDFEDGCIRKAEEIAERVFETLPHTPVGDFGVNFNFVEESPDPELFDKFVTGEKINEHYKVIEDTVSSTIDFTKDVTLKLVRVVSAKSLKFDFNFHHKAATRAEIMGQLRGITQKHLKDAQSLLKTLYNLEGFEILKHAAPAGGTKQ